MAFQIKNFVGIAAALINHMRGTQTALTDFNVGSVARTLVEAPAVEIDELYQQLFNGLKEALPVATYRSFNFDSIAAVPASGLVRVTIAPSATNVVIGAGTVLTSPTSSVSYATSTDVTITAGNTTADVLAAATTPGVVGNIPAGTVFSLSPTPAGLVSAVNLGAFINGQEAETPDQKKARFGEYINSLQRATAAAIDYGARTATLYNSSGVEIERVKAVSVVEPYLTDSAQPISLVNVYVHNGVGSTSAGLVAQAAKVLAGYTDASGNKIPGWKAAGTKVVVDVATEVAVDLGGTVAVAAGYDPSVVADSVAAALVDYVLSLDVGTSFIFAEGIAIVMAVPGVVNFSFGSLTSDVVASNSQKLMPGGAVITPGVVTAHSSGPVLSIA